MVDEQLENECGLVEKTNWVYTITPIPTKRGQNFGRYCNDTINNITKIERSHEKHPKTKENLLLLPHFLTNPSMKHNRSQWSFLCAIGKMQMVVTYCSSHILIG